MALDRLKRELHKKAIHDAQALKEKRLADAEKEQEFVDYKNKQLPILHFLQQLEDFFWECVDDFAKLSNLKVSYSNRPKKSWWSGKKRGSSLSMDDPNLYAWFSGFKDDNYDHLYVRLEVFLQQGLQFNGEYGRSGKSIHDGGYVEGKTHVRVRKNLPIESFEIESARKWLETNFEIFYETLNGIHRIRND